MNISENIVRDIQDVARRYSIKKIVLFGSRARGDHNPCSDIDLAVYAARDFDEEGLLASDIEEIDTLLKFDLVFVMDNSDQELINDIQRDGVTLYEQSSKETKEL